MCIGLPACGGHTVDTKNGVWLVFSEELASEFEEFEFEFCSSGPAPVLAVYRDADGDGYLVGPRDLRFPIVILKKKMEEKKRAGVTQ